MESLYAPWRNPYSQSVEGSKDPDCTQEDCVFCTQLKEDRDAHNFILKRCTYGAVMFNRYPYNAGHLLIIPYEHVNNVTCLNVQGRTELTELANACITILEKAIRPHGFNVGFNIGKAAGAGMPAHVHLHVLPRWNGDTNFLPTLGNTKTISLDLQGLYTLLKPHFDDLVLTKS